MRTVIGVCRPLLNQDRISGWVETAFSTLAIVCASLCIVDAVNALRAPVQLDYEEGNILNAGLRIVGGLTPYPDPHGWPVVLNPYGPLSYLLVAALVKTFGVSFTAPRVVIVLCGVGVAGILFMLLRHFGCSRRTAVGFAALFLCISVIRYWIVLLRVDMIGLVLALAGLCVFFLWPNRWLLATALFVAALFVKYTFLAAPATCALLLITKKEWKRLGLMAGTGVGLVLAGFLAAQAWSRGNFTFHMIQTHHDPYRLSSYFEELRDLFWDIPALCGLAALGLSGDAWRRRLSPAGLYLLMALVAALTRGKQGSNSNHILEVAAAVCLCAGITWKVLADWLKARGAALVSSLLLAGLAAALLANFSLQFRTVDSSGCREAYAYLQTKGNRVLSENVGVLLLSGKPVLLSNPYVYTQLATRSGWSDEPLRERLRRGDFDVVILQDREEGTFAPSERWTRGVLSDIQQNYHLEKQFDCDEAELFFLPGGQTHTVGPEN